MGVASSPWKSCVFTIVCVVLCPREDAFMILHALFMKDWPWLLPLSSFKTKLKSFKYVTSMAVICQGLVVDREGRTLHKPPII